MTNQVQSYVSSALILEGYDDDRAYNINDVQRVSGPGRKDPNQGNNGPYDGNSGYNGGKTYGSTGMTDASNNAAMNFDASDGQPIQLIIADPRSGKFALNEEVANV